jgi:hypothetical protein
MLWTGYDFPIEKYKDYRNRTVKKHLDKIKNQLRQIKDCSLKAEDKNKLIQQLSEIINDPINKKQ